MVVVRAAASVVVGEGDIVDSEDELAVDSEDELAVDSEDEIAVDSEDELAVDVEDDVSSVSEVSLTWSGGIDRSSRCSQPGRFREERAESSGFAAAATTGPG